MAMPSSENLAYRGINTGNAQCIAYRGFICEALIKLLLPVPVAYFKVYISDVIKFKVEL